MAVQTEDKKLNGAGLTTLWGIIKQFFSSKQDKVSALGSATKPVYISGDGTFGECDSYKDSTVKNIIGNFSDDGAEFAYRPSAGAVDIESGKADFGGHLETIKGNTVAWNQLNDIEAAYTIDGLTIAMSGGTLMVTGTAGSKSSLTLPSKPFTHGHKYLVKLQNVLPNGIAVGFYDSRYGSPQRISAIYNVSSENDNFYLNLYAGSLTIGQQYNVSEQVDIIDLTLIYGEGNEPTTVEQFEADYQKWFGKPLSYEDYDAGSLRPVKMTGIKTVGFNVWDEELEFGYIYNTSNGIKQADSNWCCSKNKYQCIPSAQYYFCVKNKTNLLTYLLWYDFNGEFLGAVFSFANEVIIFPNNAYYFAINIAKNEYGSIIYEHDICINLHHSGDKDGQYEPYWESVLNVPITTLKGKLNGQGSSVVVFPDGMKKAGSVYDEIVRRGDKTYAIKRVGSVDLGTLEWVRYGDFGFTCSVIDNKKTGNIYSANIVNSNYAYSILLLDNPSSALDKTYCNVNNQTPIVIKDTAYSDTTTFKTAMQGVMLYYELATYEEYLLDDFELPQNYDVDDYGTEEILLGTDGVAPILDLKYGINAGDTIKNLPHSYVSINRQNFSEGQKAIARQNIGAASQEDIAYVQKQIDALSKITQGDYWVDMGLPSGILWAKRNIDLSQANGFAASEYQYEGSFFSWGNTDGHNPVSESSFGEYSFGTGNDTEPYVSSNGAELTGDITPSFDAAHVNLGSPWRMPTKDDFAELFNSAYTKFIDASGNDIAPSTTDKRITMNGIVGIRLKSKVNGNILFFACSGHGNGTFWYYRGSGGYYWSSSLASATSGRSLNFLSGGIYPQNDNGRFVGFAVRPVM